MSENAPDQEPSIEEILASIRQIISDDDEGEAAEAPAEEAAPEPEPEPESEPEAAPEPEDDVLELTDAVEEPAAEPAPAPAAVEIDMQESDDDGDSVLTNSAEDAALAGFSKLASKAMIDRTGTGALTMEDLVKELMKPMLREWLDVHLPPLIEKVVQKELEKVDRKALDE